MKTKINKLIKFAAAGLFLIALAINVKVTLDDPFVMLSEQAIATGSSSSTSSGGSTDPCDEMSIPPGYGCENGVLYAKEALQKQSCSDWDLCGIWLTYKVTYGNEYICRTNSGGYNCTDIPCDAPAPCG